MPFATTLEVMASVESPIVHYLLAGTKQFGESSRLLSGVRAWTMTRQLHGLADSGDVDLFVWPKAAGCLLCDYERLRRFCTRCTIAVKKF